MKAMPDKPTERAENQGRSKTLALALVILLGLAGVIALSRLLDQQRPPLDARIEEERLYMTGKTVKRMSLGFNGLVADWYWMRSLQYVGRKFMNHEGDIQINDLRAFDMRLLYPLLDTATTLDPQFMAAYSYGAIVLPAINEEDAIKFIHKGIENNPGAWRLYQHLGYIYWKRGDYKKAGETYEAGAKIADAPHWMREMSARMAAEGGSHQMAREIYTHLFEQTEDKNLKELLARRLLQVDSLEERDAIRRALESFRARNNRCAKSWKELAGDLRVARLPNGKPLRLNAAGEPLDPSDTPYLLKEEGCEVNLSPESKVPQK
jgi:tetratricopeptide (TPR) repeat protein